MELILGYRGDGRAITSAGAENPHVFIDGISGSGKSFALKRMAEQVVRQGALVIAFDYTGDFVAYEPPKDLPLQQMDVMGGELRINPLAPTPGASEFVRAQRLVNLLLVGYRLGNRACIDLQATTCRYLCTCAGTPDIAGLLEFIKAEPLTKGLESALEPLMGLSQLLISGPEGISIDLDSPGFLVLDFKQAESGWMRKLLVEVLLRVIWDRRTSAAADVRCPLVLLLDECQNLNWSQDGMPARILREGRKFEIGGWFSSQWVENEHAKAALRQAAVQMHFRQDKETALRLARLLTVNAPEKKERYAQLIRSLKRGAFFTRDFYGGICMGFVPERL